MEDVAVDLSGVVSLFHWSRAVNQSLATVLGDLSQTNPVSLNSAADEAGAAERIDMDGRHVKRRRRCTACTIGAMHDGGNGETLLTLISHST